MKKLITFDLDGTLLNTIGDLAASVNYAMTELGLPTFSVAEVQNMVGNGVRVLCSRAVGSQHADLVDKAIELQRYYYNLHCNDQTCLYPGIEKMLSDLEKSGFIVAVYSNKDQNFARKLCKTYFGNAVHVVFGTTADGITKPNAHKLIDYMNKLGIDAAHSLYSGDSEVDIQTAQNANVKCISVTWGFKTKQFLLEHGAEYLADTANQVVELANELIAD